eukprot:Em0007g381a
MAAVAVGQISEFQSELESITVYLERVGQYFIANEIPTGRRVAVLLSVIGSRTYSLLRSLLHPEVPGEKTYDQLATALREHFEPKRLVVVERFHFNRRNQGNGESVLEYVAEIKRLAGTCTFGAFLTEALRDRFVCGLTNESIQRRLLSEANLDFEKAVQIARGMETAQKNSQVVQASEGRVQKFQDHVSSRTQGGQGCRHCGKRGHQAEHCRFKNAVCYRCHKKGHIEAKCKTRQDKEETKWMEEQGEDECKGHRYHVIDTLCEETMGSVFKSQDTSGTSVYRVKMEINGEMLMMEIDTGAAVSLISEDTYRKKFSKLQLTASAVRLATYTTQRIEVCGEVRVRVRLGDQEKHCRLVVVAGKGPSLLGRDWLQTFRIQWHQINALVTWHTTGGLYQYTRLPFGIASAPAIFQKLMDSVLQGMSRTVCYIDDILITGDSEDEHLKNLELVLGRLKTHGITVRKSKCVFMANSVEFLGHRIDAEGMVNYYAKFLPNLSTTISPLYTLLKKNSRWQWTEECSQAFLAAKGMLTSSKVLAHYNPKLSLILATDASSYGVGAVLTQVSEEGTERPIAYVSRTLSDAERNYAQIEKEALAIIFGVKRFHVYLYGRKFLLLTDHKPLTTIFGPKTGLPVVAASRLQRWALVLSAYQYDVKFRATEEHGNVDGLSRLPLKGERHEEEETEASIFNMVQIETLPVTAGQLRNESRQDKELSKVMRYLQNGWPEMVTAELQPYEAKKTELTIENHTLLWGMRVVIPRKLQAKVLSELHQNHPGMSRMKSLARSHVWWPNIDRDIEACVRACECCQAIKQSIPLAPMQPWTWPERPWQRVHVDFAGPFLGKMFFLLMDAHSKCPEVYEMTSTTAQKTVDILRHIFAAYGLPEQLVSDNGPQFVAKEFEDFMLKNGIRHIRSAPYHPATNGLVERFVQSFKRAMETGKNSGQTLQHRLSSFLLAYRSSPHSVTNVSPCSLFLQRELRTKLDLLRQTTEQIVRKKQEEQKEGHDKIRERECLSKMILCGQPDKEVINKEKRAVEPAPEEAAEVQIDQDETPTEVEENEDKTMERKPEVPVARHRRKAFIGKYCCIIFIWLYNNLYTSDLEFVGIRQQKV